MAIYTKSFGRTVQNAAASYTLYTAVAGITAVVRDITLYTTGNGSSGFVEVFNGTNGFPLISIASSVTRVVTLWEGRVVMTTGDVLRLRLQDALSTWVVQCAGYELTP